MRGLFPSLSDEFLKDIFDARMQSALLVKGHHYEDLADRKEAFRELERAIVARRHVAFEYRKEEGPKHYASVAPFKLVNHKGIWYLAARDGEKLKTFAFGKIERLRTLETTFAADPAVEKTLLDEDGIWLGEEKREIVMKISAEVAGYFKRRKLIANQVIEKTLEDGGLLVSAKVGHLNQVLPIVRYWIPHIRIISPEGLQGELEAELGRYWRGRHEEVAARGVAAGGGSPDGGGAEGGRAGQAGQGLPDGCLRPCAVQQAVAAGAAGRTDPAGGCLRPHVSIRSPGSR